MLLMDPEWSTPSFARFAGFSYKTMQNNSCPLHIFMTWLLLVAVFSCSVANCSVSSTCGECRNSLYHRFLGYGPCETSVETDALATSGTEKFVQALCTHAPQSQWTGPQYLTDCLCSFSSEKRIQVESTDSELRSAKNKKHVNWTWLLLLCFRHL